MDKVNVALGERSYNIHIGASILAQANTILSGQKIGKNCLVVSNETVFALYGRPLCSSLSRQGFNLQLSLVEDGETVKSINWLHKLYDAAVEARLERNSAVIALGGGVIGDLAGLAAATYMRGVPLIQIPTTLLAQVDSSIGGKVAINHPKGKNLIGTFYQPQVVIADLATLQTLPVRELKSGLAEVIKYGVIWDAAFFQYLEQNADQIFKYDFAVLQQVVVDSCTIKARVVAQDEKESGLREILNFGHSIGHALENMTDYTRYKHGEAVALGMLSEAGLAVKIGLFPQKELWRLLKLLERVGLPTALPPGLDVKHLVACMAHDKKNKNGMLRFILPTAIGQVQAYDFTPEQTRQYLLQVIN